ncbi:MAG: hypothetical protein QM607_08640 [Microbacterium sp.]
MAPVDGDLDEDRPDDLRRVHRQLDPKVGCAYVAIDRLDDRHPAFSHGRMGGRTLSGITRCELVQFGFAVFGREPQQVLPPGRQMSGQTTDVGPNPGIRPDICRCARQVSGPSTSSGTDQ